MCLAPEKGGACTAGDRQGDSRLGRVRREPGSYIPSVPAPQVAADTLPAGPGRLGGQTLGDLYSIGYRDYNMAARSLLDHKPVLGKLRDGARRSRQTYPGVLSQVSKRGLCAARGRDQEFLSDSGVPLLQRNGGPLTAHRLCEAPGNYPKPRPVDVGDPRYVDEAEFRLTKLRPPADRNCAGDENDTTRPGLLVSIPHQCFGRWILSRTEEAYLERDPVVVCQDILTAAPHGQLAQMLRGLRHPGQVEAQFSRHVLRVRHSVTLNSKEDSSFPAEIKGIAV